MKKPKTVLVVEDEKSLREAIADILRLKDYLVFEAKNGKEGVEMALKEHPDLILLDLLMPVMDGMAAFSEIRKDPWGKKVPVMILTNLNPTDDRLTEDVVENMPLYYLVKSDWKIHDVVDKIDKMIV